MLIPEYLIYPSIVAIGIEQIDSSSVKVELLWLDRFAGRTIDIPPLGSFSLPTISAKMKNSHLFFDAVLVLA